MPSERENLQVLLRQAGPSEEAFHRPAAVKRFRLNSPEVAVLASSWRRLLCGRNDPRELRVRHQRDLSRQ